MTEQCPHCLVDMGTDFDDFSPRATAFATDGVSIGQRANRARLRDAMTAAGLSAYSGEWWHFDGAGAGVQRPILNVPVN
jgi:D-alanyl-D-alanine dipeptidase